jgi:catechol 2,3-dioxygenase-like lactoylglutathione lyase family enzyme
MEINRIDHIGIVLNDLAAAKALFLDLGLEVVGEPELVEHIGKFRGCYALMTGTR